nr:hypothetical protein [Tanacetum cinerariifolium]
MSMSVQMSQVHKTGTRSQNDDKRLCLVDDLKEVQVHIQFKPIRKSSSLKSKIIMPYAQDEVKKKKSASTRLKTKHSMLGKVSENLWKVALLMPFEAKYDFSSELASIWVFRTYFFRHDFARPRILAGQPQPDCCCNHGGQGKKQLQRCNRCRRFMFEEFFSGSYSFEKGVEPTTLLDKPNSQCTWVLAEVESRDSVVPLEVLLDEIKDLSMDDRRSKKKEMEERIMLSLWGRHDRYVNTVATRPTVNGKKPSSNVFHKSLSPVRRTFNQRTAPKNSVLKEKINTAKGNPQYILKDQRIFDSRCSRHMTRNKSFLIDYQEIERGFVAFGGSRKGVPPVVEGEGSGQPSEPQPPSLTTPPEQVLVVVSQPKKTHTPKRTKKGDDDRVVRAATIAASLEAKQESEVNTSRSEEDSMEHQDDLMNFIPLTPHDAPLSRGHTPGSDEGKPNINELMNICNKLSNRVLSLEQFKIAQDLVIKRLKKKVKRLEKQQRERTLEMKLFKIGTSKKKTLDKKNVSKQEMDESGETKVFGYTIAAKKDFNAAELVFTAGDAVNAASVIPNTSATSPSTTAAEDIFEDEMTTMTDTLMAIRRQDQEQPQ